MDPNDQLHPPTPTRARIRHLESEERAIDRRTRNYLRFIFAFLVYYLIVFFFFPSLTPFTVPKPVDGVARCRLLCQMQRFRGWMGVSASTDDSDERGDGAAYGYIPELREGFEDADGDTLDYGPQLREEMVVTVEPAMTITLGELAGMDTEMLVRYQGALRDALALSKGAAGRSGYRRGEYDREERVERGYLDGAATAGGELEKTRRWGVDEEKVREYSYTQRAARRYTPSAEPRIRANSVATATWKDTLLGGLKTVLMYLVYLVFALGISALLLAAAVWEAGRENRAANRGKKMEAERQAKEKKEEEFRRTGGWTPLPLLLPGPKGPTSRNCEHLWSRIYEPLSEFGTFSQGLMICISRMVFWVGAQVCRLATLGAIGWLLYRFLLFWTKEDYERKNRVDWWLAAIIQATAAYSVVVLPVAFIFGIRILVEVGPDERRVETCELCAQTLSSEQLVHADGRKMCNEHRRQEEQRIAQELKQREEEETRMRYSQKALTLPSGERFRPVPWGPSPQPSLSLDLLHSHDSDAERLLESWHRYPKVLSRPQQDFGFNSIYHRRLDGGWKHSFTDTCTPKPRKDRFL